MPISHDPSPRSQQHLFRRSTRRQSRRRARDRELTAIHKAGDLRASHRRRGVSCRARSTGGFKDDCGAPRIPLDHVRNSARTQQYQPSRKVTANKEDQPRDERATWILSDHQREPTETTTTSRGTWPDLLEQKTTRHVESNFTNNRSKQPRRPTASSDTTATTQPNQQHTSKPCSRLTPTTKTNTTPKTTTIRFSSSLSYLKVELPQNQGNCSKDTLAKNSNQDFSPDAHLEWNAFSSQHRYKATFLHATRNPSGTHCLICLERVSSLFANGSLQWVDCMSDHCRCLSLWPLLAMSGMIPSRRTRAWTFGIGR